jgi:hypothetical protein
MLADNTEKLINGNLHHNGGGGLELGDVFRSQCWYQT